MNESAAQRNLEIFKVPPSTHMLFLWKILYSRIFSLNCLTQRKQGQIKWHHLWFHISKWGRKRLLNCVSNQGPKYWRLSQQLLSSSCWALLQRLGTKSMPADQCQPAKCPRCKSEPGWESLRARTRWRRWKLGSRAGRKILCPPTARPWGDLSILFLPWYN